MTAIDFMQELVDKRVREVGGKNRGPEIDAMNKLVGIPLGSPYCAAAVSYGFKSAAFGHGGNFDKHLETFPYSGGSQAIKRAFQKANRLSTDPNDLLKWEGALFGWTLEDDPAHGHIGFVKGRLTDKSGYVVGISTLEANTSPNTQGRDGEGCFQLRRIFDGQRHKLWFLNTTEILGGSWWVNPA